MESWKLEAFNQAYVVQKRSDVSFSNESACGLDNQDRTLLGAKRNVCLGQLRLTVFHSPKIDSSTGVMPCVDTITPLLQNVYKIINSQSEKFQNR